MALEDINKESAPQQTPAQEALSSWVSKRFESLRRDRWAEEREWYRAGLYYQQKQWLEEDGLNRKRLKPISAKDAKMPMPASNHFGDTIDVNANLLGAELPSASAGAIDSSH
jgi:hypothetical protein